MSSRSISLDQSALSPKEYQAYHLFISAFQSFTSSRAGRLRFAEAAQFIRSYFPFETEREDEIRSFFPQKVQLGEIDQGCVLAILRLLSHINKCKSTSHNSQPFRLYRDLIFLQTEPLPSLPPSHQLNSVASSDPPQSHTDQNAPPSSNPFRLLEFTKTSIQHPSNAATLPPPKRLSSPPILQTERVKTMSAPSTSSPVSSYPLPLSGDGPHPSSLPPGTHPNQSTTGLKNPFRQNSISHKSNSTHNLRARSPSNTTILTSPHIPPRPATLPTRNNNAPPPEIKPEADVCSPTPSSTKALPPPKHYSQRVSKPSDGINSQNQNQPDPLSSANNQSISVGGSHKMTPKPKILPRLQVNPTPIDQTNPPAHAHQNMVSQGQSSSKYAMGTNSNGVSFHEPKHIASSSPFLSSSECAKGVVAPSPPPAKPMRPDQIENIFQQQKIKAAAPPQEPATAPLMTLTRSQTFNHNRRVAPPLPPPRKRRESLHVHNPNSVPLDQLVELSNNFDESEVLNISNRTWANNINKRSVSNSTAFVPAKPVSSYTTLEEQKVSKDGIEKDANFSAASKQFPPRRAVSLLIQNKQTTPGTGTAATTTTTESVIEQLKSIEVGLRQDGKELVKEVKEGWRSRHGKREERVPLVATKTDLSSTIPQKTINAITNNHARNNDGHLANLVSSRWKISKHSTDNHVNLVDDNLQLEDNNLSNDDDVDDDDDDQSSDSIHHDHHFHNFNSWHQLP